MPSISGVVARALPTALADATVTRVRQGRYGEFIAQLLGRNGVAAAAHEGSYFKAINATPGTGITASIQTSFSATNGFLSVRNNNSAGGKHLALDYVRLICRTVPASATSLEALLAIDGITRYSSGGTAITALPNPNMDSSVASAAVVHAGALTFAAESVNVRRIARAMLRSAIPVALDEFLITFGHEAAAGSGGTLGGTTAQRNVVDMGPVVLGPGHAATLHLWAPANAVTAGVYEVELGWIER